MSRASRAWLPFVLLLAFAGPALAQAQDVALVTLPAPDKGGGRPLMQVLADRQSAREFSAAPLPRPVLSNLLWAAFGVNRADGHRTAPSARNWQEVTIYAVMADGVHVYDAARHALRRVSTDDMRAVTGTQPFVAAAPLNLVYVADTTITGGASEDRLLYIGADVGAIAENVYLFCASERLATVVRGSVDRDALGRRLQLRPEQRIVLTQTVGYPAGTTRPSPDR